MLSIVFVSTGLSTGGAERMLLKILTSLDRKKFKPYVVSLLDEGTVGASIQALEIPIISLRVNTPFGLLSAPFRLAFLIRRVRPQVIQGWMYHGNIFAWLGRLLAGSKAALSFGIRQTFYGLEHERMGTRWAIRVNSLLTRQATSCLFNSHVSLQRHRDFGFRCVNMSVIPNGFDITSYRLMPEIGQALRHNLLMDDAPVVGLIARFHPDKDHFNFLEAAARVRTRIPNVRFVMVGRHITSTNKELESWIRFWGLVDATLLLGERTDVSALNNMFDVACISSRAEAFPNVIGEAMACGTPCVATDVGDCKDIVGEAGLVVPSGDPVALADGLIELLLLPDEERRLMGERARHHIVENFDIERIAKQYMSHYIYLTQ